MHLKYLILPIVLFAVTAPCIYAEEPHNIPVNRDKDNGNTNRPTGLPGYEVCDDVDCYWQDGVLYIYFAKPEGEATAIVRRLTGVVSYSFQTSEGAAIPCGPQYDIEHVEIHTSDAIYYSVSDNGYDIF